MAAVKLSKTVSVKSTIRLIACVLLMIVFVGGGIVLLRKPWAQQKPEQAEFSAVNAICELATIRSFYHNVAEFEDQPDGWFRYGWGRYGYKKMWLEYNGIVDVGIDFDQVKIAAPDEEGVVQAYVPKARILNVNADKNSISLPLVDTGIFTQITTEDQAYAFSSAQEVMKASAEENTTLLLQAQQRAKSLLKEYIVNTGEQMGKQYTVKWVDDPADIR